MIRDKEIEKVFEQFGIKPEFVFSGMDINSTPEEMREAANLLDAFNKKFTEKLKMKKDKGPAFTISGTTITQTNSGITGTIITEPGNYYISIPETVNLSDTRRKALEKRMRDWYYHTQIK